MLLIVVDTLRVDHLGCYGYGRNTSPAIDDLAGRSVRFERAYTTAPWTKPAVASLLTGWYPSWHAANTLNAVLPSSSETLPEILRAHGYLTAGVISHVNLWSLLGFGQGFETYLESEVGGPNHVSTEGVTRQAIGILDEFAGQDRPFFLFVHYFDPHYNYQRHPEFGFARDSTGRLNRRHDIVALRRLLETLTPDEVRFLKDLYDEEIRFTDAGIGRLLTHLRTSGLYENTLIILTADHGEEFLERGWLGHTRTLYEELLRVPLLIRVPGHQRQALVSEEPVSLVSIVPTVLDLLGIECVGCSFQGPSLSSRLSGQTASTTPIFAEVDFRGSVSPKTALNKTAFKKAVLLDQLKLILDETSQEVELYDLSRDPLEQEDLSQERADLRKHMLRMLQSWSEGAARTDGAPEEVDIPPEMLDMLEGLGYIVR